MNKGEDYTMDIVNVYPDTQLLIFRFLDPQEPPEKLLMFKNEVEGIFCKNPRLKVLVTVDEFEVAVVDAMNSGEVEINEEGTVDVLAGECAALSLGVDVDGVPIGRISDALRMGDVESLREIKEEMLQRAIKDRCPICGAAAV